MNSGIIVAGGKGERMGPDVDKAFLSLGAKPVLVYSLLAFEKCPDVDEVVLVVRKERIEAARCAVQMFGCKKVIKIVAGGNQRQQSVANGLAEISEEAEVVAVHDGARPCVMLGLISETIKSARQYGSGVAAVKITDTVKEVDKGMIISQTIEPHQAVARTNSPSVQSRPASQSLCDGEKKEIKITDEASSVELICDNVRLVQSSSSNIKITSPDDLMLAAALMRL